MKCKRGRRPSLTRRHVEHALFCDQLRRRILVKLTGRHPPATLRRRASAKVTAARLGLGDSKNLREYVLGRQLPLEDWLAARGLA